MNEFEMMKSSAKETLISDILEAVNQVRKNRPLIHVLPNPVSAAFTADGVRALGGRVVMTQAPEEAGEITAYANAAVVNLGQPDREKREAAERVLAAACEHGIPAVMDPVGAGASEYRMETVRYLASLPWKGIIKGNEAEIRTVLTGEIQHQGEDNAPPKADSRALMDMAVAIYNDTKVAEADPVNLTGKILAVTGKTDKVITEQICTVFVHKEPLPYEIAGAGCLAGALCGLYQTTGMGDITAACTAFAVMGYALEKAGKIINREGARGDRIEGPVLPESSVEAGYASYRQAVLDVLSSLYDSMDLRRYIEDTMKVLSYSER